MCCSLATHAHRALHFECRGSCRQTWRREGCPPCPALVKFFQHLLMPAPWCSFPNYSPAGVCSYLIKFSKIEKIA